MSRRSVTTIVIACFILSGSFILLCCNPQGQRSATAGPGVNEFTGDQSCIGCHKKEHDDWLHSDHFMAMLAPNDSTVKGDFNNATFTADGVTSRFFKKDHKFFINTQGGDGKNHDYEVKFTFGYEPLQQYLVEFPGGRMQAPRLSWDTRKKKWFHQYAGRNIAAHDWLHWTGGAQNWNTMCASCHSTNLQKNYNIDGDSFKTTYSSINVSCESCHGAGKLHIDYINGEKYRKGTKVAGSFMQLGRNAGQIAQINACAPCHVRKSELAADHIQSNELMDNYIPEIPTTEYFFADGQVNEEDYTYTSFLQSKMFRRGVTCSNCHNAHTGRPVQLGNLTCLQCHAKTYDDPSHNFHPTAIAAQDCKSCHMPGKMYMGNDLRHDHSLRVPRPDLSVKYGTPNACNNCHKDKTAQWAADAVVKWYGPTRKYHFADDLIPGSKADANSEPHLLKLLGDTAVPDIVKATAAHYLESIPSQNCLNALLKCLGNNDAQIRYRALRSLSSFQSVSWIDAVGPLLADKVRAVRIAAADLCSTIPEQEMPEDYSSAFRAARNELQNYLFYQADFAVGNLMIADHYLQSGDYNNAEKFYVRGLQRDSLMNYARLNLSSVLSSLGKNDLALNELKTAAKIDPQNDRIFFNQGLLYYEMKNKAEAKKSFSKAVALKTKNPRVYYNYGLLLNEDKKYKEAKEVLQKGIAINPGDASLYYVLTIVYIQENDMANARQSGMKLKQLDPNNQEYLQLYKSLGI